MFLDRLFTPRVLGRYVESLFNRRKFIKHGSRENIFGRVVAQNAMPREGLQKVQWNVECSIEHYRPQGKYTKVLT